MTQSKKQRIAAVALLVLGIAISIVGIMGALAPPVITGVGFVVLSWALW